MRPRQAELYFHTLRHMKLVQVWGRLAFYVRRPTLDLRPAPVPRTPVGFWRLPAARQASMLSPTRFRFLNEELSAVTVGDWNSQRQARLWTYNLHYFDDLNAVAAPLRAAWHHALVRRWIAENPPGSGTGWESYPLSLRIVNWIKWALAGNVLDDAIRHSLAVQARYLSRRLERHLLGNHLFANAKALVFAGCYFCGDEAARWLRCGMDILAKEIPEQILADGGHFERSTMYHAIAYEDMLDLANLLATFPQAAASWAALSAEWPAMIGRMGRWLAAMCHPDGELAFFNDAAIGVAPAPVELFSYAERLGLGASTTKDAVVWLKESGYIRIQRGGALLLIDAAPIGPDYLPGHAHADTLSFELSLFGQRVIVNSGTSRYGRGAEREWERSTAAHSTLEVDGQSSSEVWAGFRVARRAYPFAVTISDTGEDVVVTAAHNGYLRLAGRAVHRRTWRICADKLLVSDHVDGVCASAVARYYFHPAVELRRSGRHGTTIGWDQTVARCNVIADEISTRESFYAPEFGVRIKNRCLELRSAQGRSTFSLDWTEGVVRIEGLQDVDS